MANNYFTDSGSSDGEFNDENSEDLSHSELQVIPNYLIVDPLCWKSVQLSHNDFVQFPIELSTFLNLVNIDLSNNGLTTIGCEIISLQKLKILTARNNLLDSTSVPKDFGMLTSLESLNLSGNRFTQLPMQVTELVHLKNLHLGANRITEIPSAVKSLIRCVETWIFRPRPLLEKNQPQFFQVFRREGFYFLQKLQNGEAEILHCDFLDLYLLFVKMLKVTRY